MKLAKSLIFATMLIGMSAHGSTGEVFPNCTKSPKNQAWTGLSADVQRAKVNLVWRSIKPEKEQEKKKAPSTTPSTDT